MDYKEQSLWGNISNGNGNGFPSAIRWSFETGSATESGSVYPGADLIFHKTEQWRKEGITKKAVKDKVLKIPRRYKCSYSVKDDANVTKVLELLIEASSHLDPIFNRYVAFQYFINTFLSFLCDFLGKSQTISSFFD